MTDGYWGWEYGPIVVFFFSTGIKSYTDESTNASPDQLQILTGVSMSPSKISNLTSKMVLSDRRVIAENGQVIKCNCILWHSSPWFYIKNSEDSLRVQSIL
ncbi:MULTISPECIES: hypothetical protein [unclassified Microcoleus]|uniref:hypothetical protein n=1 Tax=unclassified Microcoleus TaxID=2642155 RepID=UPI002FD26329